MIDLKFTALMDFLARLRGQYPQKIESGGAEEFVPYEDVREVATKKIEEFGRLWTDRDPCRGWESRRARWPAGVIGRFAI